MVGWLDGCLSQAALIYSHYQKDFELFGYNQGSWQDGQSLTAANRWRGGKILAAHGTHHPAALNAPAQDAAAAAGGGLGDKQGIDGRDEL